MNLFGVSVSFGAYVIAFAVATAGCVAGLRRAVSIQDAETRRGMVGLLAGSGGWALCELLFLVAPSEALAYAAYVASLAVGLATVGGWLYFCSAYTGRSFHRTPAYRRAALGTYLAIVAVKLTNPLHGQYFTVREVARPFPHLAIRHEALHWIVAGLSYALVAVGFFMLYEVFLDADYDARPLGVLAGLTGVPVVLDVVGFASTALLDVNYEPLGVAVFAVGVLYVFDDRFFAVQLSEDLTAPLVYLDAEGRIREVNDRALAAIPSLEGARGEVLADVVPGAADALAGDGDGIVAVEDGTETRYYLVSDTPFSLAQADIGRVVVFNDVTETERQRRELQRHDEQLESFAEAIRHELLNTLNIVQGQVDIAGDALADGDVGAARERLQTTTDTVDRMSTLVEDFASLARYGQTLEDTATVDFAAAVERAGREVAGEDLTLAVEGAGQIEADRGRLVELFQSAFAFARTNGASSVTVTLCPGGFAVTGDGAPLDDVDPTEVFEFGAAEPTSEAGIALPKVGMLARIHGWNVGIDPDYDDGVRLVVSGATVSRAVEA